MFQDRSLKRTTSQQRIEPPSKQYPSISARGSSVKGHVQDQFDNSLINPPKVSSAWGNKQIGNQGNPKNKGNRSEEDVYSYIQEAYNQAQRSSSIIESNNIMGSQQYHGNSITSDKHSENSKQHRISRLDEYRQTLKEQDQQNQDGSYLRSQDISKEQIQKVTQLSKFGQQQQQQHQGYDEKINDIQSQEQQSSKNGINQYQSNNYQSVYNRDDFRLTEVMDMEKQIERLKILFEFFDIWDSGLVKREEQREKEIEKEIINQKQNQNESSMDKWQVKDNYKENKEMIQQDVLEELMSKMRVLQEREDQLDAFEKDLQQLRIESDAKADLIKKEMLQIEEDMELFFDEDVYSSKEGKIRHSHDDDKYANGIAASLDNRFASLRNKEQQVAEGEKEQSNIWEQLQQSRAGMEQHLKQLMVMEEQLSGDKVQLEQQLTEELSRLEVLKVQANCVLNAQSSEQYMNKLQMRDAQLAIAEDKAAQKEIALMNQIMSFKGQQQQRIGQEKQLQQNPYWQGQQKQSSLELQIQNSHSPLTSFGQQDHYQHQKSNLKEQPEQFETLNQKNVQGQSSMNQQYLQQQQQQQQQQQYHQQRQQLQQRPQQQHLSDQYQQQTASRFLNSSEQMNNNTEDLPPRDNSNNKYPNSSTNLSYCEPSPSYKEIPKNPMTSEVNITQTVGRGNGGVRMQDKILQQMILNQQQKQMQYQQGNNNQYGQSAHQQKNYNNKQQSDNPKGNLLQMHGQESNYEKTKFQQQIQQKEQYLHQNSSRIPSTQQKYQHSSSSSTSIPSSSDKTMKPFNQQNNQWEKFSERTSSNSRANNENLYPMYQPSLQRQLKFS